jgi:hypothetical protein
MDNFDRLFRIDNKQTAHCIINCGKSNRGKSYLTRYYLQNRFLKGNLKFGLVFTTTEFNNDFNWLPSKAVVPEYDEEILEQYVENLKNIHEENGKIENNFILFEDCIGVLNNSSKFYTNFITMARHLNCTLIYNCQYLTGKNAINPTLREQTTHALFYNPKTQITIENLYKAYGQLFASQKEFGNYLEKHSKQYTPILYIEAEDDIHKNYIPIQVPSDYKKIRVEY